MTALMWIGFLVCLAACYIGAKLFYAAMDDAARRRDEDEPEYGNIYDRARESYRERLHDQSFDTDGTLRAIAEFEARQMQQFHPTDDELARLARAMQNTQRPKP